MFGFGKKKKEEPKKEETKVVKQETQSVERQQGDEWIGEFSGTKVKFIYKGPVGDYPGWK
jgi:hypothetical protein|tara:strand:- start:160 stop:339 length:180 start_codon:yes stop_codon:yes gene_type:complete